MLQNNKKNSSLFDYNEYNRIYNIGRPLPLLLIRHWLTIGQFNNYKSNIQPFDYSYYIKLYNLNLSKQDAENHWLQHGYHAGKNGSDRTYLSSMPSNTQKHKLTFFYYDPLADEEMYIKIIKAFINVRKSKPHFVLTIGYYSLDEINDDGILELYKCFYNNLNWITFKKLGCSDAMETEISQSDVGIFWQQETNKMNSDTLDVMSIFEKYHKSIITNTMNITLNTVVLYFNDKCFQTLLSNYDEKSIISTNANIFYLANSSLPKISGYTIRTRHILEEISKNNTVICFVKPPNTVVNNIRIYCIDNIMYYYYNDVNTYLNFLSTQVINNEVKCVWSASDHFNGKLSGTLGTMHNILSIYEIRGFWHYSRKYREEQQNCFNVKFYNNYDKLEKNACEINKRIFCENSFIKKICVDNYGIDEEKIGLLTNGVSQLAPNKCINYNKSKTVFGYIGSTVSYEGIEQFIEQFCKLDKQTYDTEFHIIGGGDTNDAIFTLGKIKKLIDGVDNIKYFGMIPHNQLEQYYNEIDVIILPRINCDVCNIVTPIKPFEAMMHGKVVLASSVDAINEIITHNKNGILFDKANKNDLYNKLVGILEGDYNFSNIISNGYTFCENHTWSNTCKEAISLITRL